MERGRGCGFDVSFDARPSGLAPSPQPLPAGEGLSRQRVSVAQSAPARAASAIAARLAAAVAAILALPTRLAVTAWTITLWAITTGTITLRTVAAWAVIVAMCRAHGIAVGGDTGRALMARAILALTILPCFAQRVEHRAACGRTSLAVVADPLVADVLIA